MSLQYYHIIHLIAVMALFAGTGAALAAADHGATRKFGAILRGVALLLLLVTGFGLLAIYKKMGTYPSIPLWAWLKLVIWLIAAVLPVFVKRKLLPATTAVFIALALGGVAAWLGYMKPAF